MVSPCFPSLGAIGFLLNPNLNATGGKRAYACRITEELIAFPRAPALESHPSRRRDARTGENLQFFPNQMPGPPGGPKPPLPKWPPP